MIRHVNLPFTAMMDIPFRDLDTGRYYVGAFDDVRLRVTRGNE